MLRIPRSLSFQRYSLSDKVYFPLEWTFSRNWMLYCSLAFPTRQVFVCSNIVDNLEGWKCSSNLLLKGVVVFPVYCDRHAHDIQYIPLFRQFMCVLTWYSLPLIGLMITLEVVLKALVHILHVSTPHTWGLTDITLLLNKSCPIDGPVLFTNSNLILWPLKVLFNLPTNWWICV